MLKNRYRVATVIAILLHAVGLAGILFFNRDLFIAATPYHMMIIAALLFYTQERINGSFIIFFAVCFVAGFAAEVLGTSTGMLFGEYSYGSFLGPAFKKVPLVIGVNWFIIIYCCGVFINTMLGKLSAKLAEMTGNPSPAIRFLSLVSDGAMLSVFFDWIMEPAANKLGYWTWAGSGTVPFYNYACWLVISALLLAVFAFLKFSRRNIFAVNLLLIMMMFFMLIRVFL